MNIKKSIKSLLICLLFIGLSFNSFGQKLEPKVRTLEPDHVINSTIMNRNYELYISFPANYSNKDTIAYPVLYVLDGMRDFGWFTEKNKQLKGNGKIKDVIIVGVNSGIDFVSWGANRHYDYTPSQDTIHDRKFEKEAAQTYNLDYNMVKGRLNSGGATKFLQTLKTEIIPIIEKNYKTNESRGISGHSLGGLFAAYCLINSDGYFDKFGINSPSLWWNNEEFLNQAISKFKDVRYWNIPKSKVFISVGAMEGETMLPQMIQFSINLEKRNYQNIDSKWYVFDNETHGSVARPSLSRTLIELYGKE